MDKYAILNVRTLEPSPPSKGKTLRRRWNWSWQRSNEYPLVGWGTLQWWNYSLKQASKQNALFWGQKWPIHCHQKVLDMYLTIYRYLTITLSGLGYLQTLHAKGKLYFYDRFCLVAGLCIQQWDWLLCIFSKFTLIKSGNQVITVCQSGRIKI